MHKRHRQILLSLLTAVILLSGGITAVIGYDNTATAAKKTSASKTTTSNKGKVVEISSSSEFKSKISEYKGGIAGIKNKGKRPIVVDFYAVWCGPCRRLTPNVEEVAKRYAGKVDFYRVNVDVCAELSDAFDIQGIPMLLYIPTKGNASVSMGYLEKDELQQLVKTRLLKK